MAGEILKFLREQRTWRPKCARMIIYVTWCVECECFVSETVRSEDGRLWSKPLKACWNWDLLCCGGHNTHWHNGMGSYVKGVCICVCVCVCAYVCVFMSVCVCIIGDGLWLTCVYVMLSQRTATLLVRQLTVVRRAVYVHPHLGQIEGRGRWTWEKEGNDMKRVWKRIPVEFSTVLFRLVINNIRTTP